MEFLVPLSACLNVKWETAPSEGTHDPLVTPAQNTTNVALWPRLLFYNSIVMYNLPPESVYSRYYGPRFAFSICIWLYRLIW